MYKTTYNYIKEIFYSKYQIIPLQPIEFPIFQFLNHKNRPINKKVDRFQKPRRPKKQCFEISKV